MNMKKTDSTTEARSRLNFLTLKEKRKVHEAVFVQKAMTNKLPMNITKQYLEHLSTNDLRSSYKGRLTVPKHKTKKYEQSTLYRTISTWNMIPNDLPTYETNVFQSEYQSRLLRDM